MKDLKTKNHSMGRRDFLSVLSAASAMGIIGVSGVNGASSSDKVGDNSQSEPAIPTIALGQHRISRLICGSNPILGYSYMGSHSDQHMKEYYTTERTVEVLQKCEQAGITAHQFSSRLDYFPSLYERGSKLKFISLDSRPDKIKETIEIAKPIAMVHHGGVTDRLFSEGNSKVVHEYVKIVKDKGLLAGVSAHNPNVIKQIADEGWEVDFFMTCFYYLTRKLDSADQAKTLPVGSYSFFKDDPKVMTQVVRQVKQPCLGFKILGAGRLCSNQASVRAAFKFAFDNIKPTDGVIVGMFPWYFDEIGSNARYARELGTTKG
jgi:hypothetical protein